MYFINTRNKIISNGFLLHALPTGAVFLTILVLTFVSWRNADQTMHFERSSATTNIVNDTENAVTDRLESYRLVLLGASGLFVSSDKVTREEWSKFISSYDIKKNYPGVKGIGYMRFSSYQDLPNIIQKFHDEGLNNIKIHPDKQTEYYGITTYFVPKHESGLGYNMISHPSRHDAIMRSKETGEATISNKVNYTKTEMPFSGIGFSMYAPVYQSSDDQSLAPQNRDTRGFVYAPFLASEFFKTALSHTPQNNYGLKIYDKSIKDINILYQTENYKSLDTKNATKLTKKIELFGQIWIINYVFSPDIVSSTTRNRPLTALLTGFLLSFLLSGFVLSLLITRTRVYTHSKQLEVQAAKDELLSLASHQLRTPATSVKQYIGMVLEGFAGNITKQQNMLLSKAYESNERQLHIINEILYVAKIDAKGIVLTPRRLSISELLKDLRQELKVAATKNNQKLRLQLPSRQIYIEADEHGLRMAIENLISNAIKYSPENSTINIKLISLKNHIKIIVKDKGIGIASEDMHLLFQRFSRIPNDLSRRTSGSGIGLYLSKQLVLMHNGDILVESELNKGTTFTVKLPKRQMEDETNEA